ncbi:MAG: xanthine dehydrogenase family protein subunit M [Solirubrobacteraceae bacterium]
MLLRSVGYERPATLHDALAALGSSEQARVLAGGQSLINVLKHRVADCDLLVDISRLEPLEFIEVAQNGTTEIGAAVTYDELDRSTALREAHPVVANVAASTVDQQVRCRGTIGGNACYNDPSSNFPPLLVALRATMHIASPQGDRSVPAEDFFHGPFDTAVEQGELLRAISLPPLDGQGVGYSSILLAEDSWALARACSVLRCNGDVQEARVVLGCVGPRPLRAHAVEQRLQGSQLSAEALAGACAGAGDDLSPVSDVHASAEYRREMAAVVTRRAVLQAAEISS